MAIPLTTTPVLHHFTVDSPDNTGESKTVVYYQAYAGNVLVEWPVELALEETDVFVTADTLVSPASEASLLALGYEM